MRWSMMCSVVLVSAAAVGCEKNTDPSASLAHAGSLTLALSTNARDGQAFRLRDASFDINGCSDATFPQPSNNSGAPPSDAVYAPVCVKQSISTENNLDQSTITQRYLPGGYSVNLSGPWYLEQQTSGNWSRVDDKVVLLSPVTQQAYVSDGGSTQISYVFGVGGDAIDFRHGDIGIGIQVERPSDHACDVPHAGTGDGLPPQCRPDIAGTDMAIAGAGLGSAGTGAVDVNDFGTAGVPSGAAGAPLTGGAGTQAP